MAHKSSNKKIAPGDFLVGEKYRFIDVFNKDIIKMLSSETKGIPVKETFDGNDLEQMFSAYLDEQNVWTLNLNSSFYAVGIPEEVFSYYVTKSDLHWPTISYNIYHTTRLAWLLMKLNDVKDGNIFDVVPTATAIKYLDKSKYIDPILAAIQEGAGVK